MPDYQPTNITIEEHPNEKMSLRVCRGNRGHRGSGGHGKTTQNRDKVMSGQNCLYGPSKS